MYIARIPNRSSPPAYLLRESYRENGKVKNRTWANLSSPLGAIRTHQPSPSRQSDDCPSTTLFASPSRCLESYATQPIYKYVGSH